MPDIIMEKTQSSAECKIMNITCNILNSGKEAVITWKWPYSQDYIYCFMYEVPQERIEENISAEEIVEEYQAEIFDRRTPRNPHINLERTEKRCVLFPARYEKEKGRYVLLAQQENNMSDILKVRPIVQISICYEDIPRGFLGLGGVTEQRVKMILSGDDPLPGAVLVYHCCGRGRDGTRFGIALSEFWKEPAEIIIRKGERVSFEEPKSSDFQISMVNLKK